MLLKKLKIVGALGLLCSFLLFTSCGDDPREAPKPSFPEIVATTPDLSLLSLALKLTKLEEPLQNGVFTVFAPTNAAFQELLSSREDWNSLQDIPIEMLTNIIKYHIIGNSALKSTDLVTRDSLVTINGDSLAVISSDGIELKTNKKEIGKVVNSDIEAFNGVAHIVNKVLVPRLKTIAEIVDLREDLNYLDTAIKRADLIDVLSAEVGVSTTLFAPTDAAFQVLLDSNVNWNSLEDIQVEYFKSVMQYHLFDGIKKSTDLTNGVSLKMFNGEDITVINAEQIKLKTKTNQTIVLLTKDIEASNGIVHIIDAVMVHKSFN